MFAYCENNPVMRTDSTGELFSEILAGALVGGAISALNTYVMARVFHEEITPGMIAGAFVSGAIGGALTFTAAGKIATIAVNTAASVAGYVTQQAIDGEKITAAGLAKATATGAVTGFISGKGIYADDEIAKASSTYNSLKYNMPTKADADEFFKSAETFQKGVGKGFRDSFLRSSLGGLGINFGGRLFDKATKWLFG